MLKLTFAIIKKNMSAEQPYYVVLPDKIPA